MKYIYNEYIGKKVTNIIQTSWINASGNLLRLVLRQPDMLNETYIKFILFWCLEMYTYRDLYLDIDIDT